MDDADDDDDCRNPLSSKQLLMSFTLADYQAYLEKTAFIARVEKRCEENRAELLDSYFKWAVFFDRLLERKVPPTIGEMPPSFSESNVMPGFVTNSVGDAGAGKTRSIVTEVDMCSDLCIVGLSRRATEAAMCLARPHHPPGALQYIRQRDTLVKAYCIPFQRDATQKHEKDVKSNKELAEKLSQFAHRLSYDEAGDRQEMVADIRRLTYETLIKCRELLRDAYTSIFEGIFLSGWAAFIREFPNDPTHPHYLEPHKRWTFTRLIDLQRAVEGLPPLKLEDESSYDPGFLEQRERWLKRLARNRVLDNKYWLVNEAISNATSRDAYRELVMAACTEPSRLPPNPLLFPYMCHEEAGQEPAFHFIIRQAISLLMMLIFNTPTAYEGVLGFCSSGSTSQSEAIDYPVSSLQFSTSLGLLMDKANTFTTVSEFFRRQATVSHLPAVQATQPLRIGLEESLPISAESLLGYCRNQISESDAQDPRFKTGAVRYAHRHIDVARYNKRHEETAVEAGEKHSLTDYIFIADYIVDLKCETSCVAENGGVYAEHLSTLTSAEAERNRLTLWYSKIKLYGEPENGGDELPKFCRMPAEGQDYACPHADECFDPEWEEVITNAMKDGYQQWRDSKGDGVEYHHQFIVYPATLGLSAAEHANRRFYVKSMERRLLKGQHVANVKVRASNAVDEHGDMVYQPKLDMVIEYAASTGAFYTDTNGHHTLNKDMLRSRSLGRIMYYTYGRVRHFPNSVQTSNEDRAVKVRLLGVKTTLKKLHTNAGFFGTRNSFKVLIFEQVIYMYMMWVIQADDPRARFIHDETELREKFLQLSDRSDPICSLVEARTYIRSVADADKAHKEDVCMVCFRLQKYMNTLVTHAHEEFYENFVLDINAERSVLYDSFKFCLWPVSLFEICSGINDLMRVAGSGRNSYNRALMTMKQESSSRLRRNIRNGHPNWAAYRTTRQERRILKCGKYEGVEYPSVPNILGDAMDMFWPKELYDNSLLLYLADILIVGYEPQMLSSDWKDVLVPSPEFKIITKTGVNEEEVRWLRDNHSLGIMYRDLMPYINTSKKHCYNRLFLKHICPQMYNFPRPFVRFGTDQPSNIVVKHVDKDEPLMPYSSKYCLTHRSKKRAINTELAETDDGDQIAWPKLDSNATVVCFNPNVRMCASTICSVQGTTNHGEVVLDLGLLKDQHQLVAITRSDNPTNTLIAKLEKFSHRTQLPEEKRVEKRIYKEKMQKYVTFKQ